MLDKAIQNYLQERKDLWLAKKIKANSSQQEVADFTQQANLEFSPMEWIASAAKRAKQMSIVSHPSKFSHSSAKTSAIISESHPAPDGFLRSGNVEVSLDVVGNAAALDVYRFLHVSLEDGRTLLQHLEGSTDFIEEQFSAIGDYQQLRNDFLEIKQKQTENTTSDLVKQVYFPVDDDYHLLSLLNSSGLSIAFKDAIDDMHFSESAKAAKDAKKANEYSNTGYAYINERTLIGYGGNKPQNISYLNSKSGGVAYLLHTLPPNLAKRTVSLPTRNFFTQTIRLRFFKSEFMYLHKILEDQRNNKTLRDRRDEVILSIVYQIGRLLNRVREHQLGWSDSESYHDLPGWQKIWLDQKYLSERNEKDGYLKEAQKQCARWLFNSYEKLLKQEKLDLDGIDLQHVLDVINDDMEALR